MKIIKFFALLVILLLSKNTSGQCVKVASGFGNNSSTPSYNITGGVEVTLNTDNTITLKLSDNFSTASGPDVRAYLINPGTMTTAMLKGLNSSTFPNVPKIMFGIVASGGSTPPISPNGAKTFTVNVPAGVTIGNYTKIYFYCEKFGVFWDFGTILGFTPQNCTVLSTADFDSNKFQVYPNPVIDTIRFGLDDLSDNLSVNVYNTIGALVLTKKGITKKDNVLNINNLNSGIYIIELKDKDNNSFTKRFIKQ
jgi:Secretion system C-terminal sorting domain/Electron transfer DM13